MRGRRRVTARPVLRKAVDPAQVAHILVRIAREIERERESGEKGPDNGVSQGRDSP